MMSPRTIASTSLLLVTPVLDFGGVESRILLQARAMGSLFGSFRVCCFHNDGSVAAEVRSLGVQVDVLNTRPSLRNPIAVFRLWKYMRRLRPDIVHAQTGAMTVIAILAAYLAGVPVRICEEVGIPTRGRVGRVLFPHAYRLATHVIGVSDAVSEFLVERDGVPVEKVTRIYNAIDTRFFNIAARKHEGPFRFVSVGRLVPEKDHAMLIRSASALTGRGRPPFTLTIVGDGPLRQELSALVAELGLEECVRILGFRTDVAPLLEEADAFVLPSSSEGFGLALVEAMAARLPVVATQVGGVPEVLAAVAPEWIVPPEDEDLLTAALEQVMDLPRPERAELGERLRQYALTNFGVDRYAASLLSLYLDALDRGTRDT